MKLHLSFIFFAIACIAFGACKKGELPIEAHNSGEIIVASVNLETDYKWQIYYDLKTNTVVSQNLKTVWDLGFETSASGYHIVLNTSKVMFARNTNSSNFAAIVDTLGFATNKKWDESSGNFDSTAIGNWLGTNNVYIIDRGYDEKGIHQGFRKIQFQEVDANAYKVRFAQLNGTGDVTMRISKDSTYNFTFLSFNTNSTVLVEPPKSKWDLVFTQYTHIFYDNPPEPYLVTGCLINRYNTGVAMDSLIPFTSIDLNLAQNFTLNNWVNSIGYSWKIFDGSTNTYTTNLKMNYIIKKSDGLYYKLHFIDFYNSAGVKGFPKWEYQQL